MAAEPALDVVREALALVPETTHAPSDVLSEALEALSRLGQLVDAASALDYVHELDSNYPPGWNWERDGDYVLNEDGSKKHAEDCAGCRFEAALRAVAGDPDNQEVVA